jgi:hypothetical protein
MDRTPLYLEDVLIEMLLEKTFKYNPEYTDTGIKAEKATWEINCVQK